jgi:hypothetical protein
VAGGSPDDIRAHIEAISIRTQRDLSITLSDRSWPGGSGDRTEPGAVSWLRRWRPTGPAPLAPLCGCAKGRCLLCN